MVEGMKEQAAQSARQAHSMAALAYESKRDSEVMKAITVVTLIFFRPRLSLYAQFSCLELTTYPHFLFQTIFSMGFFSFDHDKIELSRQGWIYVACTLPLTFFVVGVSFAWIWWTGKKLKKPFDHSFDQVLAQSADTLSLGTSAEKGSV